MAKVSAKRQVTLPAVACKELGIKPGDDVQIFCHKNQLTVIKALPGSAAGSLMNIDVDKLESNVQSRRKHTISISRSSSVRLKTALKKRSMKRIVKK